MRSKAAQKKYEKYQKAYRKAHREENRAYCKAYRLAHLEERKAYDKARGKIYYEQNVDKIRTHRRKVHLSYYDSTKNKYLKMHGSRCACCGYDKNIAALEFHHVNGKTKGISFMISRHESDELLKAEIDKCVLLCANCHAEHHHGGLRY